MFSLNILKALLELFSSLFQGANIPLSG